MNTASYSSKRSDHADSLIACLLCSNLGSCFDHSKYRNIQFILHRIQGKCTCCVAGDHDCLDLLLLQKMNDLSGITNDCILGFTSIRNSRRIAKINDLLRWKISHDLPGNGKTAYSGIKYTDRCISVYFHKSISPVLYVCYVRLRKATASLNRSLILPPLQGFRKPEGKLWRLFYSIFIISAVL